MNVATRSIQHWTAFPHAYVDSAIGQSRYLVLVHTGSYTIGQRYITSGYMAG